MIRLAPCCRGSRHSCATDQVSQASTKTKTPRKSRVESAGGLHRRTHWWFYRLERPHTVLTRSVPVSARAHRLCPFVGSVDPSFAISDGRLRSDRGENRNAPSWRGSRRHATRKLNTGDGDLLHGSGIVRMKQQVSARDLALAFRNTIDAHAVLGFYGWPPPARGRAAIWKRCRLDVSEHLECVCIPADVDCPEGQGGGVRLCMPKPLHALDDEGQRSNV